MKSLCISYFNNKNVFILKRLLLIISIPSNIDNYESENAAQRDYFSNDELTFISNEEKFKWRYKKDTFLRQSKKYRT